MVGKCEVLGQVGRFMLGFSALVLLSAHYYRNYALAAIAFGIFILGGVCHVERSRLRE
jgi:hypothetical protein